MTYSNLQKQRADLLKVAIADTKKRCISPQQRINGARSDQFWLDLFHISNNKPIDTLLIETFLLEFGLNKANNWINILELAERILQLCRASTFDPVRNIVEPSHDLMPFNKSGYWQPSAASKFTFFAKPCEKIFIWDTYAKASAAFRNNIYRPKRVTSRKFAPYNPAYRSYDEFYLSCEHVLSDEKGKDDFNAAVHDLEHHFSRQDGPMADRNIIPLDFIERRFLDKLMYWEGRQIEHPRSTISV